MGSVLLLSQLNLPIKITQQFIIATTGYSLGILIVILRCFQANVVWRVPDVQEKWTMGRSLWCPPLSTPNIAKLPRNRKACFRMGPWWKLSTTTLLYCARIKFRIRKYMWWFLYEAEIGGRIFGAPKRDSTGRQEWGWFRDLLVQKPVDLETLWFNNRRVVKGDFKSTRLLLPCQFWPRHACICFQLRAK